MKTLLTIASAIIVSSVAICQDLPKGAMTKEIDLSSYFSGYRGCFVLYDFGKNEYSQYNPEICRTRYTPCSTFKIPNSLIALETGVANDTSFIIKYDSTKHPIDAEMLNMEPFKYWPYHQSMTSAFRHSVVWYYQELAKKTGEARMQRYLDSLQYGNRDISSGIDHFWLGGSMKISADEQVEFIKKLLSDRLEGFSVTTQEKVKGIMLSESTQRYKLYGKTGGCDCATDTTIGWYVGFVETRSNTYVFSLNIFVKSFDSLAGKRIELTKRILQGFGVL
jgi:beta-lactamase class D